MESTASRQSAGAGQPLGQSVLGVGGQIHEVLGNYVMSDASTVANCARAQLRARSDGRRFWSPGPATAAMPVAAIDLMSGVLHNSTRCVSTLPW